MITKATEGTSITDSKFIRFMDGMKQAGYVRGCYHFHRKALSPLNQADFFCKTIKPYIDRDTLLILDVEEGGESAAALQTWFNAVRAAYPQNRTLLYSRRDILEQMLMTAGQKEFFQKIPVWAAGYPTYPDKYDYVPTMYMPDPSRFGAVVLWQYSAHGAVEGIVGDVDLNWIEPAYYRILGGTSTPPEDETGEPMTTLYGTVTTSSTLQIRSGPGISYADIGDLHYGDKLEASESVGGWWKLTKILRLSGAVEIPGITETYAYANSGLYIRTDPAPIDPQPAATLKHTIKIYSDGSYQVDSGNVIP
jgi:lysozyme